MKKLFTLSLITFFFSVTYSFAQHAGSLDNTFNGNGIDTTSVSHVDQDYAFAVVVQSDGKIVVGGSANNSEYGLVRYKSDGTLDSTFNGNGIVRTSVGNYGDGIHGLAIQPDGKILAAGGSYTVTGSDFTLARYNPDGSLDGSFGTNGTVISSFGSSTERAFQIAIQTDGKILAGGQGGPGGVIARYKTNGVLDSSFGTNGKIIPGSHPVSFALQKDGKILAAGDSLARYNTNGSIDTTFGIRGKVMTNAGGIVIQSDGKLLQFATGDTIKRFYSNGNLDTTFKLGTPMGTGIVSTVIQNDGKIVAAASTSGGPGSDFLLERCKSNGSLDSTFGTNGKVTTSIGIINWVHALALQSDGKIIAAGTTWNGTRYDFAVVRYLAAPCVSVSLTLTQDIVNPLLWWSHDTIIGGTSPFTYYWTFGDGNTSNVPNPSHTYSVSGHYAISLTVTDANGCTSSTMDSTYRIQSPGIMQYFNVVFTGTESLQNNNEFSINPNPTTGMFNVLMNKPARSAGGYENVQIKIFDILGECIYQHIVTSANQQIDLSEACSGIYFLQVKTPDGVVVKKIMKE